MKIRLLILLAFILFGQINCFAGDSIFFLKLSAGLNFNQFGTKGNVYNAPPSHFGSNIQTLTYNDTFSFSPIIKINAGIKATKIIYLDFNFCYNYSKLSYSSYTENSYYSPYPPNPSGVSEETKDYKITLHKFVFGLGPQFRIKQFYIEPKFNICNLYFLSKVTSEDYERVNSNAPTTTSETSHSKDQEWRGGAGLVMGYDFKIKKTSLFVELQSDYIHETNFLKLMSLDFSFMVGIEF